MREGGENCVKYLKRGWSRTERRGHKDFKKGGKLGQWVGALKKGRGWNTLTNYDYVLVCKVSIYMHAKDESQLL